MLEPPFQNSFASTAIVIIGGSRISRVGGTRGRGVFKPSKPGCRSVARYLRHCFLAARHAAGLLRRDVADHRDTQQVQHRDAVGESDHLRNVVRVSWKRRNTEPPQESSPSLLEQYKNRTIISGTLSVSWNSTNTGSSSQELRQSGGTVPTQDHHLRDVIRVWWNSRKTGSSSQGHHQSLLEQYKYRIIISGKPSESPGTVQKQDHHFRDVTRVSRNSTDKGSSFQEGHQSPGTEQTTGSSSRGHYQSLLEQYKNRIIISGMSSESLGSHPLLIIF